MNKYFHPWSWKVDLDPGESAYLNLSYVKCKTGVGIISYTQNDCNQNILFTVSYTNEADGNGAQDIFKIIQKTGYFYDDSKIYIWGGSVVLQHIGTKYPFKNIKGIIIGFD